MKPSVIRSVVCVVLSGVDGDVDHMDQAVNLALSLLASTKGAYYDHIPNQMINARFSIHIGEYVQYKYGTLCNRCRRLYTIIAI